MPSKMSSNPDLEKNGGPVPPPNSRIVDSSTEKDQDLISNTATSSANNALKVSQPPAIETKTSSYEYVSPASSTTGATTPFTPMDTISMDLTRKNSDEIMKMPPVHSFFNQYSVYDSDGSDGR